VTGVVSVVALIALTVGIFAGVPLIYLFPPCMILVLAVTMWEAWRESKQEDATEGEVIRPPSCWFLLALGYTLGAQSPSTSRGST
jgi:hypothetical protein